MKITEVVILDEGEVKEAILYYLRNAKESEPLSQFSGSEVEMTVLNVNTFQLMAECDE